MSYMYVIGRCFACDILFTFNADWVPSFPEDGIRQPICHDCILRVNAERRRNNLPVWSVHPEAYEPSESI